jgi:putative heme-binding domain-containing protein
MTPILTILLMLAADGDDRFLQNVRTTEPQSPQQQAQGFHVPDGFEVQLVAAEPDIPKPINLAFDASGRLWVSGSLEYPYPAEDRGRDSINVLEDTDNDGRADRVSTFVDGLNIPMGLYPYRDGVIAYSIDRIDFWRDTDGDGRADQRQPLFGPLGKPVDTHGMQNAFRRGLDGWLYINHGFANDTTVRGLDGSQITLNSGNVYRVRLDGSHVEQFTWGQVNPFGSDWTEAGDLITADCHSKPLTLLLRGGYYSSFGKPHDGLGFAPELMNHHHGSTGLAGVAYYADGSWPDEYRGSLFVGNVVTSRVHRDLLKFRGATARADEQPDFLTCDDPWFRPVDLRFGPDGALYIADFYNRIIGHYEVPLEHPGRDRERGRIWRVVYRGASGQNASATTVDDLTTAPIDRLIEALEDPVLARRLLAVDQLSDRCGEAAVESLRRASTDSDRRPASWRRRALARWVLLRLGQLHDEDLQAAARDGSALARRHAMQMLAESPHWSSVAQALALAGISDTDANVRRAAADALGQHPHVSQVQPLLTSLSQANTDDEALLHMLRLALRNQLKDGPTMAQLLQHSWSAEQRHALAQIALAVHTTASGQFVLDFLDQQTAPGHMLASLLQHAARNLPEGRAEHLARIARQQAGTDLSLNVSLYQSVAQALPAAQRHSNLLVAQWGRELTDRLIEQVRQSQRGWSVADDGNPWGYEPRQAMDGDQARYLSSLPGGEREVSRLTAPIAALPAALSFYLCGHRGDPRTEQRPTENSAPEEFQEPLADNYVQLRLTSDGRIVRRAFAPRNDIASRIEWDLSDWQGEPAVLEVIDNVDAEAYAWLAVAGFEPNVLELPGHDPRQLAQWQQWAARLIADMQQPAYGDVLQSWVRQGVDWPSRSAAAAALSGSGEPLWQVLGQLLADMELNVRLRHQIADEFAPGDSEAARRLYEQLFQHLTQLQQASVARQLASSAQGAQQLLALIQQGRASGRLLQRPAIREQLRATGLDAIHEQVETIIATLPPEDDQLTVVMQATRDAFQSTPSSANAGKALFVKHCSTCHQVQGQGTLVGPQLDGIGNRGLERTCEDVLAPYRNVDAAFRSTILTLDDGQVLSGLVRQRDGHRWVLVNSEGKELTVTPESIEQQHISPLSIMPDNFSQVLTAQERNDLLAYLLSLRQQ